jgi:malonyl-CoA/methylmalonyl-CoA synthetase
MIDTLSALVRRALEGQPDDLFLTTPDGRRLTYGNALLQTAHLAAALRRAGAGPGARVAVQIDKSPLAALLYLACVRCGAVYVPMNTGYTDPEADYLLEDVEPAVVIRDPSRQRPIAGVTVLSADQRGDGTLAELAATEDDEFVDAVLEPGDPGVILYTSGTTGRPKGAVLSQRNLASNAQALTEVWQFEAGDVLLHALPLFHAHGLFISINCVLVSRSSMVLLPRFDVDSVLDTLPICSVFMGVPTFYTRLLADSRLTHAACENVRLFTAGSAPLPASVHVEFERRTGHAVVERYGMTETGIITSNQIGDETPGAVGRALPEVEVRIADAESPGGTGSVEVRGPNVFSGYWKRPELTATEFTADGYFKTGDLGHFDDRGRLTIAGRTKDLIISGGYNVYPREVEVALEAIEAVDESAVVGEPDRDLGERVVAFVVPRDGAPVDPEAVRSALRASLAGYKVPKRVHVIDELPRNAMGKVEKTKLRQQLETDRVL